MDNIRFVLVMAMLMISYMLWESWQIDYGPKPQAIISDKPVMAGSRQLLRQTAEQTQPNASSAQAGALTRQLPTIKSSRLKPTFLQLEIDTVGGTIRNLDLAAIPPRKRKHLCQSKLTN